MEAVTEEGDGGTDSQKLAQSKAREDQNQEWK